MRPFSYIHYTQGMTIEKHSPYTGLEILTEIQNLMRTYLFILSFVSMVIINFTPFDLAMADINPQENQQSELLYSGKEVPAIHTDQNLWNIISQFLTEAEAEKKIFSFHFNKHRHSITPYEHDVKNLYAIPIDHQYLLDEPPNS